MESVTIDLPWPPTVNTYWRRHGTVIHISNRGREYATAVYRIVRKSWPHSPIDRQVAVLVELWPPTKRQWDVDNRIKAVFDALTKAKFWRDDSLVRDFRAVDRRKVTKGGACRVTIWPIKEKDGGLFHECEECEATVNAGFRRSA